MKYYVYGIYDKKIGHYRAPVVSERDPELFSRTISDLVAYHQFDFPEDCEVYLLSVVDDEKVMNDQKFLFVPGQKVVKDAA